MDKYKPFFKTLAAKIASSAIDDLREVLPTCEIDGCNRVATLGCPECLKRVCHHHMYLTDAAGAHCFDCKQVAEALKMDGDQESG